MTTTIARFDTPHRRFNALTGEWIVVSPQRTQRPWQGRTESAALTQLPKYDPECYLCPGNVRANAERNPSYDSTFTFTNDFPAFLPNPTQHLALRPQHSELLRAEPIRGECRVLCFSPRHDLTLAQMTPEQIRSVIDLWAQQATELGARYRWVQIFENKGELMGCSNAHPHGQIWAGDAIPNEAAKELARQREWFEKNRSTLLGDYAALESREGERVVEAGEHWIVVVPWWAVWPFETLILPRRPVQRLPDLTVEERHDLARVLKSLLTRYDGLFETSFPYSFGWHGAPNDEADYRCWQLHAHIYPPLLRSATVRKFAVGYEMLAEAQRDLTAEQAAERLRRVQRRA